MKNLLFPFVTPIIFSVIFSVTLTACGGGSAGGSASNLDSNFTPSNDFTLNPLGTIEEFAAKDIDIPTYKDGENDVAYDSLTKIADDANTENPIDVILHGLAVLKNDSTTFERDNTNIDWKDEANNTELKINREITLSRITAAEKSPAVKLTFGADGAISGVTIYADEEYTNATADRSNIFGFTANYMAHISWNLAKDRDSLNNTTEDNIYDIDGIMLAGIQTADDDIPISGSAEFNGKGKGVYGSETENYNTIFDVTANVNFTGRDVIFTFSNTCKIVACADNSPDRLTDLDFSTGKIKFAADANSAPTNNISGDVTLTGGLAGKLDARFYGRGENNFAKELGGTFALVNATNKNYYYGAFGGQYMETRNYILNKDVVTLTLEKDEQAWNRNDPAPDKHVQEAVPDVNAPTYIDTNDENKVKYSYESIDDLRNDASLADETTLSITLPLLGTHRYYRWNYQRHDSSTDWGNGNFINNANIVSNANSVVTLNYHVKNGKVYFQGKDGTEGIVLYRKTFNVNGEEITNRYAGNTGVDNRTFFKGNIIGIDEKAETNFIRLFKGDESGQGYINYFGFVPKNIIALSWYIAEDKNLLGADNLEANTETNFGRFIAGLETGRNYGNGAFGAIPETGNVTFIGKGTGNYGYVRPQYTGSSVSKREQLYFNIVAYVDFATKKIDFSTYNTCYVTTCTIKRKGLDFNTTISFTANNIASNVTTSNGLLTGKLETRFYGKAAEEFGGSFALIGINDDIYYYGIFAGNQDFTGADGSSVDANKFDSHYNYPKTPNIPYVSFAEAAGANKASQFVVQGSAVQKHDITYYARKTKATDFNSETDADVSKIQDISLVGSDAPALKLDFDATGNISAIEAYFGFSTYTATLANGATGLTANGTISNADYNDAETSNITVDRNAFGFKSNYMVYLSWNLDKQNIDGDSSMIADDKYNINGMMVAGIDTPNMPTRNSANFFGAGKGNYGDKDTNHKLTFKTFAEVNFSSRKIEIEMSDTACVASDCGIDGVTLATLDFSGLLTYSAGANNAIGDMSAGNLSGAIYARFYGTGDNAAGEFGGTFALKDSTHYYYGAFGADKGGTLITSLANSIKDVIIASPETVVIPTKTNGTAYASFRDAIIDNNNPDGKIFRLQGPAVYGGSNAEYNRTAGQDWREVDVTKNFSVTKLSGASASITVTAKKISDITLHLNGKTYTADKNNAISDDDGATGELQVSRHSNVFGFHTNNIVYVNWSLVKNALTDNADTLNDNTYTQRGMMLVGNESPMGAIPTANYPFLDSRAEFKGKGRGYYTSASGDEKGTKFNIDAMIDFSNKEVSLTTSHLKLCTTSFGDCKNNTTLNFVTEKPISYTSNDVSGKIVSRTYDDPKHAVGDFTGTVNAKFYGAKADEFGGAFALLADDNAYHYGIFGTQLKNPNAIQNALDHSDDTGAVTRVNKKNGSKSPNDNGGSYDSKTYAKYDSFLKAQSEIKGGQNRYVHNVALAATREDTVRYQRYMGKGWTDDSTKKETVTVVANLNNATSYIRYYGASPKQGVVNNVRIFSYKRTNSVGVRGAQQGTGHGYFYRLYDPNDTEEKRTKHNLDVDAGDYHYITASNPIKHSFGKLYSSNIAGNLTLMRPNEFGFQAKYMAYIRWTITKTVEDFEETAGVGKGFDIDGYMVSGFETEHNTASGATDGDSSDDLPETGTADFVGGGMGTYHHASGQGYRTRFDANAKVDFEGTNDKATIDLTLNNTRCVAGLDANACTDSIITPDLLSSLNITNAALGFDRGENDITAIAIDTDGGMNGQIDARFYGQNRKGANNQNAAKEFGGAFSFRDGDKSYIGIFGTERGAITPPTP